MAACSGYSSGSESEELPQNRINAKSFSIESLLAKNQPNNSYMRWERNPHFLTDFSQQQICPVPPNIIVPANLFRKRPARKNLTCPTSPAGLPETPHETDSSGKLFQMGEAGDSDQNTDGEAQGSAASMSQGEERESWGEESSMTRKKRPRTTFSVPQIRTLEAEFEHNRYLTASKKKELSKQLKLSETQIKIWFQNRRTKLKRKNVSEMETWIQQLYSPLGPMAPRPLVIGDRLYLFNNPGADVPPPPPPPYFSMPPVFESWR